MTAILMSPSLPAATPDMAAVRGSNKTDGATDAAAETGGFSQVLDRQHRHGDNDVRQPSRDASRPAADKAKVTKDEEPDESRDADASATGLAAIALQWAEHTSALRQSHKEAGGGLAGSAKEAAIASAAGNAAADAAGDVLSATDQVARQAEAGVRLAALPAHADAGGQALSRPAARIPTESADAAPAGAAARLVAGPGSVAAADAAPAGPAAPRSDAASGAGRRVVAQTDGMPFTRGAASASDASPAAGNPIAGLQADATLPRDVAAKPARPAIGSANAVAPSPFADPSLAALSPAGGSGVSVASANAALGAAVGVPLGSPNWAPEFGRQFVSLVKGGHDMPHTAELRLDPPELGPLRISIQLSDNVAHAVFVSPHGSVRHTVEQALPQLQQALEQAGISLGQTSVSDQGQAGQAFEGLQPGARSIASGRTGPDAGADSAIAGQVSARRAPAPDALVDTFA